MDKLSINVVGPYGFLFSFDIIDNKVMAQYSESGELNYKYFAEEAFSSILLRVPVHIEKFVLDTPDWKKGETIYGYCELLVDPYYVDIKLGQPLHLQRSFKLYFKVEIH